MSVDLQGRAYNECDSCLVMGCVVVLIVRQALTMGSSQAIRGQLRPGLTNQRPTQAILHP